MMCIHECQSMCVEIASLFLMQTVSESKSYLVNRIFPSGFLKKKRKEKETKHIFLGGIPSKQRGKEQGKKSLPYFR